MGVRLNDWIKQKWHPIGGAIVCIISVCSVPIILRNR